MKLIITGTGRSGTRYMSNLFTSIGVETGHEQVYRPNGLGGWIGQMGESSYAACAYSQYIPKKWPIYHIHRDPLLTLRSQLSLNYDPKAGSGFWNWDETHKEFGGSHRLIKNQCPTIYEVPDAMSRAIRFINLWSLKIYKTFKDYEHYKIGKLNQLDVATIRILAAKLDVETTDDQVKIAIKELDREIDSDPGPFDHLSWDKVLASPQGHLLDDVRKTYALGDKE